MDRIQTHSQFYQQAANGTLPSVSWVMPYNGVGEHPASGAPIWKGQRHVTNVVNALMQRPGLERDRDLPHVGRLGRFLRPRQAPEAST